MIKAAVIGLRWWGQTILKTLVNNKIIAPVLGVDPSEQARTAAAPFGIETAPGPTRSRWKRCWRMSEGLRRSSAL